MSHLDDRFESLDPIVQAKLGRLGMRIASSPPGPENDARMSELLRVRGVELWREVAPVHHPALRRALSRLACMAVTDGPCTGACVDFVREQIESRAAA
jgi:hypothetical protein